MTDINLHPNAKDLTGMRFGRLLVLKPSEKGRGRVAWNALCDCGNATIVRGDQLGKRTNSCGCLQREISKALIEQNRIAAIHGHRSNNKETSTYISWSAMKRRCFNPKCQGWDRYGGRGITVCERWLRFENFLEDMGERPIGHTISRKDHDGNYEPANCEWAPKGSH